MKFTCLQENLVKGLSVVCKAVPAKSSLPILSNVLILAEDGRLKLSATNLETAITTYVGASIEEEGAITVPAKSLLEFISHLSPTTIEAELKSEVLHLQAEKTRSKFNGVSADDYPELPVMPSGAKFLELDPKLFGLSISAAGFAASLDAGRPVLGGIMLSFESGILTIVSTDGFRLSEKVLNIMSKVPSFTVVVPAKTLMEVARIFNSSEEPIKFVVNASDNLTLFEAEDVLVSTRIIDGEFPDYRKIVPQEKVTAAEFSAESLLEAVRLTNVFAKEANSVITMVFDPEGLIRISSSAAETGENKTDIEASIEGDPLEVAFNSKYLLDLLNNVGVERFIFESKGNLAPGVFKPVGDKEYFHIIMPIRMQS